MTGQPAVPAAQVSAVLAWAARLAAPAGTIETAAYLTAKASVLERIAAERAAGGWTPADIAAARQAAARARDSADTAALLAAAGITALKED